MKKQEKDQLLDAVKCCMRVGGKNFMKCTQCIYKRTISQYSWECDVYGILKDLDKALKDAIDEIEMHSEEI